MTLKVQVARTAYDLKHVNRLKIFKYGVTELRLVADNGRSSKSHSPPGAPVVAAGSDSFHFAPENEKLKIVYKIEDPEKHIKQAKLELFFRQDKKPVWSRVLKPEEFTDGEHKLDWDGKTQKDVNFPEEYVTVQHSPYKLKITIGGIAPTQGILTAWTYFHILVYELKLELGLKDVLHEARDQTLYDVLKDKLALKDCLPAPAAKKEVKLISNLFSTGGDLTNNQGYIEYENLWQDGPNIPVFAKLTIKKSDDSEVDVPKAVGTVKLLWEWEDVPEDLSMHFTQAKEYLEASLDRYKATTKPKGDNCHKDHKGKRGDDSKPVFPAQAGYAPAAALLAGSFPFKVEQCSNRKWCSYSSTWPTGKLMGQTGVLFQPARMAGDGYIVRVYFPHQRQPSGTDALDNVDDKPLKSALQKSTGTFQIWREVHIVKYYKKHNTIPSIDLAKVADYYQKAYLHMEDKSGGPQAPMPNYDAQLRAPGVLGAESANRQAAVVAGNQGTITQAAVKYLSYADWKTAIKAANGWNNANLNAWLNAHNVNTLAGYKDYLEAITDSIVPKACDAYLPATDGVTILQFNLYWEAGGGLESSTNGFASTDFPSSSRKKAAFIQCRVNYTDPQNNMQQTTTHETGHTLFLPHTFDVNNSLADEKLHDQSAHWNNCTMSYNYDKERKFCGLCLLRLRGWDQTNLDKNRTLNRKT